MKYLTAIHLAVYIYYFFLYTKVPQPTLTILLWSVTQVYSISPDYCYPEYDT